MLALSSRGVLAFGGVAAALLGGALGVAGWDPFHRPVLAVPADPKPSWDRTVLLTIAGRARELQPCWNDPLELGRSEPLRPGDGFVVPLSFELGEGGRISEVTVASMKGTQTDECVRARLQSWKLNWPVRAPSTIATSVAARREDWQSFTAARPEVQGSLDWPVVDETIQAHHDDVARCYRERLSDRRYLRGEITVSFWISQTGEVLRPGLSQSTSKDDPLDRCVTQAVGRWIFPAPPGQDPVFVRYVFNFTPTGW